MKTKKKISPAAVAPIYQVLFAQIQRLYALNTIQGIDSLKAGNHRSLKWRIRTSQGDLLLKRRRYAQGRWERACLAHEAQQLLSKKSFPVAPLVRASVSQKTLLHQGQYICELFHWVAGQRFRSLLAQAQDAGRQLAHLHVGTRTLSSDYELGPGGFHDADLVRRHLVKLLDEKSGGQRNRWHSALTTFTTLYQGACQRVNALGFPDWETTVIHGDWHPGNLIFRGDTVAAVLDFDAVRWAPGIVDLANGLLQFSMVTGSTSPGQWPAQCHRNRLLHFWLGYQEVSPVPAVQVQALPDLMIETLIAETVLPIAATGLFDRPHGLDFVQAIQRKLIWINRYREALVQAFNEHSLPTTKIAIAS